MNEALVIETLTLLCASALGIALVSRVGLPAMLGYLLAGVVATAAYVASNALSTEPLLGASGAIAGVMGVYLVYFPRAPIRTLILIPPLILWPRVPAWLLLILWFVSQFFVSPGSAVAWTAHVGGFLFGAGVGWLWRRSATIGR